LSPQLQKFLLHAINLYKTNTKKSTVAIDFIHLNLSTVCLSLAFCLMSLPVIADTNAAGVEINVSNNVDIGTYSIDPVQSYLPDNDGTQPNSSAPDTNNLSNNPSSSITQAKPITSSFTQLSSDDLWGRIKDGYAMPELKSSYVTNHTKWYAARPDYVLRMTQRSQKYLYHIVEEVQKRGMPTEIALLPMIESAFNPKAYSTSRASGIWQFIPSTGKNFGLKQNWWVDNRRGVTAATDAALTYLQKLHGMFGSWDLALAAYNAGEGTVQRAINRNRNKGLPTDYENLSLPEETKNYVPKLQAIKNIMSNPEQYGIKVDTIPNRPYFTKVNAPQQIDVHLAAKLAEISFEEFSALNPEYNRPVVTSKGNVHEILLPVSAAQTFTDNLSNYDKPLVSWQAYHAKRGERMDHIANKFGINVAQLREANGMSAGKNVASKSTMLVPSSPSNSNNSNGNTNESDNSDGRDENIIDADSLENNNLSATSDSFDSPKRVVMHKVKKSESIAQVAKKYGVNTKLLIVQNHLKSGKLKTGQMIKVSYSPFVATRSESKYKARNTARGKKSHAAHGANKKSSSIKSKKSSKLSSIKTSSKKSTLRSNKKRV